MAAAAQADQISWTNAGGGNWSTGTNWSSGTAPGAGDTAQIILDGTYTVTLDIDPTVAALELGAASGTQILSGSSAALTVNGPLTVNANGVLNLSSSTVPTGGDNDLSNAGHVECVNSDIELNVVNTGTMLVQRGCQFTRSFVNEATGTLTIEGTSSGNGDLTVDGTFTNRGAIDLTSDWPPTATTAYLRVPNEPLVNEATGDINGLLGVSFNSTSTRYVSAELHNSGTVTAVSTGLSVYSSGTTHVNDGTLYAQGGHLSMGSGSTFHNNGTITVDAGASVGFGADSCWIDPAGVTNNGTMNFSNDMAYITDKFTNAGTITVSGMSSNLYLMDTLFNDGTLSLHTNNLLGDAPLYNRDSLTMVNADVEVECINAGVIHATITADFTEPFTSEPGSKIVVEGDNQSNCIFRFHHTTTNHGEIELTQSDWNEATVTMQNSSDTLINAADGVISAVVGTGAPVAHRNISALCINNGTITVDGPATYLSHGTVTQENHGTIDVVSGNLYIENSLISDGDIAVASGAYCWLNGDHSRFDGGTISGTGDVRNDGDTVQVTAAVTNAGVLNFSSTKLILDANLTNTGEMSLTSVQGAGVGNLENDGSITLSGCTLGHNLINDSSLVANSVNTINGIFVNNPYDTLWVVGKSGSSATFTTASGFNNHGAILLTSEVADGVTTATVAANSGTVTNQGTGVIVADKGSSTGGTRYLTAALNNQGLIYTNNIELEVNKSGASHTNSANLDVRSAGMTFTLGAGSLTNSGQIRLQNMQTMTVDGGDFITTNAGRIYGDGSMNLYTTTVTYDGYIEPGTSAGRINIQSNFFDMGNDAQMNIEVGGLSPTTQHDQVMFTVNAGFGGVLDIDLIDGFIPAVGDSFEICTYDARTSNFSAILGLNQYGVTFDTNFTANSLWLVTSAITNDPPVISGMPGTLSMPNDSTAHLLIWDYLTDDYTSDTDMVCDFTVSNDSLNYVLNAAGILVLTAEPGFEGSVTLGFTATDEHGASSSDTTIVTVTASNTPPVISGLVDSVTFRTDSTFTVDIYSAVSDAETADNLLGYMFESGHVSLDVAWDGVAGEITLSAADEWSGSTFVAVTVTDPETEQAVDTIWVTVSPLPEVPPVVNLPDSIGFDANDTATIDIWPLVTDDSHDTLLYYAFSTTNDSLEQSYNTQTGVLTLTATDGWGGVAWLKLTVTDPDTLLAHDSCEVYVIPSLSVDDEDGLPTRYALEQNYPNPFNPTTTIEFALPAGAHVRVVVYNVLGEAVRTLTDRTWPAGMHRVQWNGRNESGRVLSSGVYFYRLEAGDYSATRKMLLIK
ncbi:T9SS type A sorting domain-containing protein [candidate division GN15 bacterium]|nr:T9SS type A sorting domain-containing protein [candidate division GN15 bacterium]